MELLEASTVAAAEARQNENDITPAPWSLHAEGGDTLTANRSFDTGAILFEIQGEILTRQMFEARYVSTNMVLAQWAFTLGPDCILDARNQPPDDKVFLMRDPRWSADAAVRTNAKVTRIGGRLFVAAIHRIREGAELVVDFGTEFWGDSLKQIMMRILFHTIAIDPAIYFTVPQVLPPRPLRPRSLTVVVLA